MQLKLEETFVPTSESQCYVFLDQGAYSNGYFLKTNVTSMAMSLHHKTPQSGQVNLFKISPTVTIYKTCKPNPINQANSIA